MSLRDFLGSPVVKTLPSNAGGTGLIPGCETKIPNASWPKKPKCETEQYCNRFNKDLKKNSPYKESLKMS